MFDIEVSETLRVAAGHAAPIALRITPAAEPGRGAITLTLRGPGTEETSWRWSVRRTSGMHPLRLRASGLARGREWVTTLPVPADAERIAGRVVLLAPSALAADPDLADLRRRDPALVAWSDALAGRRSDPELWARFLRAQQPDGSFSGDSPVISTAAAALALANADESDGDAAAARARLHAVFTRMGALEGADAETVRTSAAALAALAAGGVPALDTGDPVLRAASSVRRTLRRTLREHPEEPSLLARAAAALLLADPADSYGLAMLERASAHLADAPDGGARVTSDDPLDALSATFALAIAAHQAGEPELAERLVRGGLAREHVALRRGGETALWLLACGAYGVLGVDPEQVVVRVDGVRHEVALEQGRAALPIPGAPGTHQVRVLSETGVFVRAELAMERPYVARNDGPLALELRGDPGAAGEVAALELSVKAAGEVGAPVVDLSLPAGIAPERVVEALRGAASVVHAEAREPGIVRVTLARMLAGTEVILPLPMRWTVRGELRGLAAVAYPAGDPGAMSVLPERALRIDSR